MNNLTGGHRKANCPSCGAEVRFASSVSIFAVCSHCRSMLVRHDMDLEALGEMAQLPGDVSPLKIGSRGRYSGTRFEVIGRLKVAWSEGYWNEWFLRFEDGMHGWLGEAMGFFMLSFEERKTGGLPARSSLVPGKEYPVAPGRKFTVDDIRETVCIGSEGELPFRGLAGRKATSVDLSSVTGGFANIEYSAQDSVRLYVGRYVKFDDLEWSNLRDLDAELKKVRAAELFKCPSCGGPISLRTPGLTAAVVCSYCGSTIDATNEHLAVLHSANKKMRIKPLIPIGTKGVLFGTEWEVTGYQRRTDGSGAFSWDEYLLFHPTRGFRWLTTADGHWNFVDMLRGRPELDDGSRSAQYRGRLFKQFLAGSARTVYVLGEFYWRVKVGEKVKVADYVAPPEILSSEGDRNEVVWSLGRYLEPQEIGAAFKLSEGMQEKRGIFPNQPSPYVRKARGSLFVFLLLTAFVTMLQVVFSARALDREIYSETFAFDPAVPAKALPTPSFDLPAGTANVEVRLQAPVSNDWMEASIALVDDATQQSLDFEQGVEYYFGRDSDGPWTEGSDTSSILLSSIPGGRYHLVVQPTPSSARSAVRSFRVTLRRDVIVWSNYVTAMLLLFPYPLYAWMRNRSFEAARWADSDFSPYSSGSDDEGE